MTIDLTSLTKALASLSRAVTRATGAPEDEELRDAVIQRFEYSYELSWKMMRRVIVAEAASTAAVAGWSFRDLLREAGARGLVDDVEAWFEYRHQRNITAHTYDEDKAASVFETALRFLPDAQTLLHRLEHRVDA
jgi:nucleotidyltransferase substrate binding protein (TIGR01987 family)